MAEVILARNWFGPNGIMYRKGADGASVSIPNSIALAKDDKGKPKFLPKGAKVVNDKVSGAVKEMPIDSRPKPGSGDPNADVQVEAPKNELHEQDVGRKNADETDKLARRFENKGK